MVVMYAGVVILHMVALLPEAHQYKKVRYQQQSISRQALASDAGYNLLLQLP
jgi:hypothetical protein